MMMQSTCFDANAALVTERIFDRESGISLRPSRRCPAFRTSCSMISHDMSFVFVLVFGSWYLDVLQVMM